MLPGRTEDDASQVRNANSAGAPTPLSSGPRLGFRSKPASDGANLARSEDLRRERYREVAAAGPSLGV